MADQIIPFFFFFFILLSSLHGITEAQNKNNSTNSKVVFHAGVILDLGSVIGKMGRTSISMAVEDFYAVHSNYNTRLDIHYRDSNNDAVQAAFEALDLLKNVSVQVIIGPQTSQQASFLIDLGNKTQVPIVSFSATSPAISSSENPYFIRTTPNDSAQVKAISDIITVFEWRQAVLIYEDTDYGRGVVPYIVDALQAVDAKVSYRSVLSLAITNDEIMEELYKMKTMATRVFIVHMSGQMGARLFLRAKDAGMMSEGYSWILTDGLSNIVDSFNHFIIDAMQGVVGVRLRMPKSLELKDFNVRWKRRFRQDHPSDEPPELSIYGLLAYDTTWSLAMSIEEVRATNSSFNITIGSGILPISIIGPKILQAILANNFTGVSGEFHLFDGQSRSSTFEIINVVGRGARVVGYWTPNFGLSKELGSKSSRTNIGSNLNPILWPGESFSVPKGWEIPTTGTKLKIGTPVKRGFPEFVNVTTDKITNVTTIRGYNIDVFEAALSKLHFELSYEYIPFMNARGEMAGTYDDLIYEVYRQNYDAVVGDTTIRANRTKYVDFTLPYNELGVSMIVPVKRSRKDAWLFTKPLSVNLWLGILVLFISTGLVVLANERRINRELSRSEQFAIFFFLPTLIFDSRDALKSFISKLVVIAWVFVLLILRQSYTANLASLLTVEQLEPTITSLNDLQKNDLFVGYFTGSFVGGLLPQLGFDKSKLKSYSSPDEFAEALIKGTKGGGVSAIVHEIPYIKSFLAKYCEGFTMVGPVYQSEGFGFAFPRNSPLVPEISRALLKVLEGNEIIEIEKKWFGDRDACANKQSKPASSILYPSSFLGLFLIFGGVLLASLFYTLSMFLCERWGLSESGYWGAIFGKIKAWFGMAEIDKAGTSPHGDAGHGDGNPGLGAEVEHAIEMVVPERTERQGANKANEAQRHNEEAQKLNEGGHEDQGAQQHHDRRIPGHPRPNMRNRRGNEMRSQSMPVDRKKHSAKDEIGLLYA